MDTKSKSFKYSYGAKTVALLLVFVLIFSSAYSLFTLFRSEIIFADAENRGFTSTPAFINNAADDARSIMRYAMFDEELAESYALFCAKDYNTRTSIEALRADREKALKLFDIITEFKKKAPSQVPTEAYTDEYGEQVTYAGTATYNGTESDGDTDSLENGDYSSSATSVYDTDEWLNNNTLYSERKGYQYYYSYGSYQYSEDSSVSVEDARTYLNKTYTDYNTWQSDYAYLRKQIFSLVTDATSRDTISLEFDNKISQYSQQNWNSYVQSYNDSQLDFLNLKYVIVDNLTGKIKTNFEDGQFDFEKFTPNLPEGMFHVAYKAGEGLISGGCTEDNENADAVIMLLGDIADVPTAKSFNTQFLDDNFGTGNYNLYLYIGNDLQKGDAYHYLNQNYLDVHGKKTLPIAAAALLLLSSVLPLVFLCSVCGHKRDNTLSIAFVDRIPFIFHLAFTGTAVAGLVTLMCVFAVFEFSNDYYQSGIYTVMRLVYSAMPYAFGVVSGLAALFVTEIIVSAARLLKNKCFMEHTLIYHVLRVLKRIFVSLFSGFRVIGGNKKLTRTAALFMLGYLGINVIIALFIGTCGYSGDGGAVFFFILILVVCNAAAFTLIAKYIKAFERISALANQMQQGNFDVPFDTAAVPKAMRPMAEDVLRIRDSIKVAVDEALKGERMKTELITNVSHDLKTPLTSIITYVDLLKKCDIEDGDAVKYLEVLDDKSKRLKRLIEDLVEASKASTGNVKINAVPIDLYELSVQAMGEHDDVLAAAGLDAVINSPEVHPVVFADSQHTWRVIDNLFSNAKKYAMPGTRVYVDVGTDGTNGVFSMKNISCEALNIPASELTARFVRGDSSRTGEGSGLGLSIAQSLCELQHGTFSLEIDGDLFKATVKLPLYKSQIPSNNTISPKN